MSLENSLSLTIYYCDIWWPHLRYQSVSWFLMTSCQRLIFGDDPPYYYTGVVPPATQYHKHSKSLSWSSTHENFHGSLPSPEDGDSFSVSVSDHSLEYAMQQADASPFHSVKSKGNWKERVKGVKLESPLSDESSEFNPHRSKTIIQDMIDMSLSKKRIQSSEKMLRSAFIEFYRGLGLLKSYRWSTKCLSSLKSSLMMVNQNHYSRIKFSESCGQCSTR